MYTHEAFETGARIFHQLSPEVAEYTEAGFILQNTFLGPNDSPTLLEDWQITALQAAARYQWWGKSRQVGFSWASAMQKLARAWLFPEMYGRPYLGIFLSINKDEAAEKIFYVQRAYDTLPNALKNGRLKLVRDSRSELEFANGSRILSHPAKAVRGKAGADITIDEAAHIAKVAEIYRGTTAASIRAGKGQGGVTLGSTPLGEVGLFYEAGHSERSFLGFRGNRYYVYWWDSVALCEDVLAARRAAVEEGWAGQRSQEAVRERVTRFGSENLRAEFDALPLEDFLQEYEVGFNAIADALIPYSLLQDAVDPDWEQYMYDGKQVSTAEVVAVWGEATLALRRLGVEQFWAGYDFARKRDQAVLVLVGALEGCAKVAARVILRDTSYETQEALLNLVARDPRCHKINIDVTGGMGASITEKLVRGWGETRVEGVNFTNTEKRYMASKILSIYSQRRMTHTGDREILRQAGAVRKKVSPTTGNVTYEGGGPDHHADVFWALALATRNLPLEGVFILVEGAKGHVAREEQEQHVDPTYRERGGDFYRDEYRQFLRELRRR